MRAKLQSASWGQAQIVEASHLVVFANITNFSEQHVDEYFDNLTTTREIQMEAVQGYKDFVKNFINTLPVDVKNIWTSKQTYIALSNLLNAAAELKIDVTPMEGFEPQKYNEILGLNELGLNASLVATIGYRHEEDGLQHLKKVRKSEKELFLTL